MFGKRFVNPVSLVVRWNDTDAVESLFLEPVKLLDDLVGFSRQERNMGESDAQQK